MEPKLKINCYEYEKTLKKGIRSTIIQAKKDDKEYAVRVIKDLHDYVNAGRAVRELMLLRNCKHENIINISDLLVDSEINFKKVYIVMPLMDFTLGEFISHRQCILEWRAKNANFYIRHIMSQILKGLDYLHCNKIIHRDLTPHNIMINKDYCLKIIDFEISRDILVEHSYFIPNPIPWNIAPLPPYGYAAPERLLHLDYYDSKVDTWSAGVIYAELICGYGTKLLFPVKFVDDRQEVEGNSIILNENVCQCIPANFQSKIEETCKDRFQEFLIDRAYRLHESKKTFPSPLPDDDNKEAHSVENGFKILNGLLLLDPAKRWSASDALKSEFFSPENTAATMDFLHCEKIFDETNHAIRNKDNEKLQELLKSQIQETAQTFGNSIEIWHSSLATRFQNIFGDIF